MEEEKKTRQEGMTRRGKIILTVFAGAVIVFLIWWLIPRSFEGITGMKGIRRKYRVPFSLPILKRRPCR